MSDQLRLSHDAGPREPPLKEQTIGECFEEAARGHPHNTALVCRHQNTRLTYAELAGSVEDLAAGLLALGLEKGDRVGIWAPNCTQWLLTQLATARAGMILVTINPAYRRMELEYALNTVQCRALVFASRLKSSDYLQILGELAPELSSCDPARVQAAALPHLRTVICLERTAAKGIMHFDDVAAHASAASRSKLAQTSRSLHPDEPINIQFTSGTTGAPKGATLTHRNILNNGFLVGEALGLTERDVMCIPVPLYHCFGMVMGNLGCITHAATMVYPAELFDPLPVIEAIEAERCTALYGVPAMFIAMLNHPQLDRSDLSSLRTGIMAGAPCPLEVMKRVATRMHLPQITIAYGMTETSPVSTQTRRDDPLEVRVSTVGRVHPHVAIKIMDASGNTVPRGSTGEFCTKGYCVMRGYWEDEPRTREAIDADDWMHTGDLASMDEHGYVKIVGRLKDMVIRGGENIYPREIEELLYRHPKVKDANVIGVPDRKYGEELCAWIVLHEGVLATAEEIRDFFRGHVAHFKVPKYVCFVESFPMTVTGKVQKFLMRQQSIAELGLEAET